jgi:hypothetical protein
LGLGVVVVLDVVVVVVVVVAAFGEPEPDPDPDPADAPPLEPPVLLDVLIGGGLPLPLLGPPPAEVASETRLAEECGEEAAL